MDRILTFCPDNTTRTWASVYNAARSVSIPSKYGRGGRRKRRRRRAARARRYSITMRIVIEPSKISPRREPQTSQFVTSWRREGDSWAIQSGTYDTHDLAGIRIGDSASCNAFLKSAWMFSSLPMRIAVHIGRLAFQDSILDAKLLNDVVYRSR